MKITVQGYSKEGHFGMFTTNNPDTAETLIDLFFEKWWYASDPSVNMGKITEQMRLHGSVPACMAHEANIARAV